MLDFTKLNQIPAQIAKNDFTEPLTSAEGNLALKTEKPATGQNKPHGEGITYKALDRERKEREKLREAYSTYQDNIRRAGSLRSDILKGITRGEDPLALLLKAIECISNMTGDTTIYKQGKEDIIAIYGQGIDRVAPLHIQIEEAQHRLQMLERPELLEGEISPVEAQRIKKAITAHRELINALEAKIKRAEREEEERVNHAEEHSQKDTEPRGAKR